MRQPPRQAGESARTVVVALAANLGIALAKLAAAMSAGAAGWAPWTYGTGTNPGCDYYIMPGDPTLALLGTGPTD